MWGRGGRGKLCVGGYCDHGPYHARKDPQGDLQVAYVDEIEIACAQVHTPDVPAFEPEEGEGEDSACGECFAIKVAETGSG